MRAMVPRMLVLLLAPIISFAATQRLPSEDASRAEFEVRQQQARELVTQAIDYIEQEEVTIAQACHEFITQEQWKRGFMQPMVCTIKGTCLMYGDYKDIIWHNLATIGQHEEHPSCKIDFPRLVEVAQQGGFFDWLWYNGHAHMYVAMVKKQEQTYLVGAGFFPEMAYYVTQDLVDRAVQALRQDGAEKVLPLCNSRYSPFVQGDITLIVLEDNGVCRANANHPALVGQNLMDWKTSAGTYLYRDLITFATTAQQGWQTVQGDQAPMRVYVKTHTDKLTGKKYIIAGCYYPGITMHTVLDYVRQARALGEEKGLDVLLARYGSRDSFYASLRLFIYDDKGVVLLDTENPNVEGEQLLGYQDQDGHYVVRDLLQQTKEGQPAWLNYYTHGSYKMVYAEKLTTSDGKSYVIGSGYYPSSKQIWTAAFVDKAVAAIEQQGLRKALSHMCGDSPEFVRGGLFVRVFDEDGTCLAAGPYRSRIWHTSLNEEASSPDVRKRLKEVAEQGGGFVRYKHAGAECHAYVKMVTDPDSMPKDTAEQEGKVQSGRRYMVFASYYS